MLSIEKSEHLVLRITYKTPAGNQTQPKFQFKPIAKQTQVYSPKDEATDGDNTHGPRFHSKQYLLLQRGLGNGGTITGMDHGKQIVMEQAMNKHVIIVTTWSSTQRTVAILRSGAAVLVRMKVVLRTNVQIVTIIIL